MYFKRSLNKIVKVRPFVSSLKYSYGNPLQLSTFPRSFSIGKKNSQYNVKPSPKSRTEGINLMAPNLKSNSILKSTSKHRKELGGQFHTMPRKSLILKLCRQPSQSLSTSHTIAGHGQSNDKPEKNDEVDKVLKVSKTDICRTICGPNSSKFTSETLDGASQHKVSKTIIDSLTDAEIDEICKTRCPCRESHASNNTVHTAEKAKHPSTSTVKNAEKLSTSIQSVKKVQDPPSNPLSNVRSLGNVDGSTTNNQSATFSNVKRSRKSEVPRQKAYRIYPAIAPYNISREKDKFRSTTAITNHPMPESPNQLTSNFNRMMRSKQLRRIPSRHPPTPASHTEPNIAQAHQTKSNRSAIYRENMCHFEQLKPVPFRFLPTFSKNHHSDPVVKSRSPKFDAMPMGMPYKLARSPQWYKRQRHQMKSSVFGSESSKNRQTLQSSLPTAKLPLSPIEIADKDLKNTNVSIENTKENLLPPVYDDSMQRKTVPTNSQHLNTAIESTDTAKRSRQIMSKLVENLSVVIEGPAKLKLVTSSYPQLRDEKDVIIQMEYVNLTDADTKHYLTGKYNSYSYATAAVGRTGSGIVIETGKNVHNVKPGDKVFVKPISCGKCSLCLSDRRNLCEYVTTSETSPTQGIFRRLHVHSSEFVTKIPENVSLLNGAMTWTLSTAIRACQKADVSAGDFIMVIDGGPLGIATALAAQLMGATTVCLADPRKSILDEAQKLGIDKVFQIDPKSPSKNTAIKIWEHIGDYPRVTFDCRASQLTNEVAINATQTGGKVVVMTNSEFEIPLSVSNIVTRDIDIIISTFGNDESDIAALRILSTKKICFGKLTCKHFDLSNVQEAFEHLYGPNRLDSQIMVKCGCKCGKEVNSGEAKS